MTNDLKTLTDAELEHRINQILPLCSYEGSDWDWTREILTSLNADLTRRSFSAMNADRRYSLIEAIAMAA